MSENLDITTELVGVTVLDTIGLVIANVDKKLREQMALPIEYSSLGLISSRTGAAGQIVACDEAVKAANVKVVTIDLPRDTKGWGGHGCYIVLAATNVEDVRYAVKIALAFIKKNAGEVHISQAGHLEFAFSPNAGEVLHQAFNVPYGKSFGFLAGSPAAIGQVMTDTALKTANIDICRYLTPSIGTSHSNEVILAFSGTVSAVKEAVIQAKRIGMSLLASMGSSPESPSTPFLII